MKELNEKEKKVIETGEMEAPFSGLHYLNESPGIYFCKRCGEEVFYSEDKFHSGSGWPSFDDCNAETVSMVTTEERPGKAVLCKNCNAFLGNYIVGEGFTNKNKRFNINSIALKFSPQNEKKK